jgi:hypothetical protein
VSTPKEPPTTRTFDADATLEHVRLDADEAHVVLERHALVIPPPAIEKSRRPSVVRVRPPSFARARIVMGDVLVPPALRSLPGPPPLPPRRAAPRTEPGSIAPIAIDVVTPCPPPLSPPRCSLASLPELGRPTSPPRSLVRTILLSGITTAVAAFSFQALRAAHAEAPSREPAIAALPRTVRLLAPRELSIVSAPAAIRKATHERAPGVP